MTSTTTAYFEFLCQVETALAEALDGGALPTGHSQRDEFEAMRREVAELRRALAGRIAHRPQPVQQPRHAVAAR